MSVGDRRDTYGRGDWRFAILELCLDAAYLWENGVVNVMMVMVVLMDC